MIAQDCLTGYIGAPACGASEPESGLWITDHPGLPLISFDKIADSDKQTWKNVWETIQKRAIDRLVGDVQNAFATKYRLRKLRENFTFPQNIEAGQTAAAAEDRGFKVEFNENSNYAYSSLFIVHFQLLRFWAVAAANDVVFEVKNEITGEVVETKTMNLSQGWNTVWTNKHFSGFHFKVTHDATNLASATINLPSNSNYNGCSCCEFCLSGCDAKIRGIAGEQTGLNTYGFSGVIGIHCSFERVICDNKYLFRLALWYALAYEALRERVFSERLNKFTTVDRKIARGELMPDFFNNYLEALKVTDGIDLNDSCCLECDAVVSYQTVTL